MNCPKCHSDTAKVVDSRCVDMGARIRRRYKCECGHRFNTHETIKTAQAFRAQGKDKVPVLIKVIVGRLGVAVTLNGHLIGSKFCKYPETVTFETTRGIIASDLE